MQKVFEHQPGDRYLIVGRDARGKRFRMETSNPIVAAGLNPYEAKHYQIRNGKMTLIESTIDLSR